MDFSISWQGAILVGALKGELGFQDQIAMSHALNEMSSQSPAGIVLDFSQVVYLASMGIGMLMKLAKDFADRGIHVRLAAPRPGVKMLLEMVRAESIIPMDASIEASVQQLSVAA